MRRPSKAAVAVLQSLESKGQLRPKRVVAEAKKKTSPLHKYFEWDVKKAAEQHWLNQARRLIATVTVEIKDTKGDIIEVPEYVSLDSNRATGSGYTSWRRTTRDIRAEMLATAKREMEQFIRRYDRYKELNDVITVMRRSTKKLQQGATKKKATKKKR